MSETNTTDTTDAPLPIDIEPDEKDVHEEFVAFGEAFYGVATTLQIITHDLEKSEEIGWTQEKVDLFQEAFKTGERVLEHDASEDFKQEEWGALPDDLVEEVFETMAPLAPIYDTEMEPPDGIAKRQFKDELRNQLRRLRFRRGS